MKKTIKSIWHAIKVVFTAVVDWVATLFGMKDNSKYGRVLHRVLGTAFAVVVVFWAVTVLVRFVRSIVRNLDLTFEISDENVYFSEQVSDDIAYYSGYYGYCGYLENADGKKVLKHITSIGMPLEGDSLVWFCNGEKRGYFHMHDGSVAIKPVYEHAWIFSEGLASVEMDRKIKFIDTEGRVVIDRGFAYDAYDDGYVFHKGHCAVNSPDGKHMGLIDRNGDWVLPPVYKNIYPSDTFWVVRGDHEEMILTFGLDTVMPATNANYWLNDSAIWATYADHSQAIYSLQGRLIAANQISAVEQLMYDTREVVNRAGVPEAIYDSDLGEYVSSSRSDEAYTKKAVATCLRYEAESNWYGLLGPDGRRLTPPSYSSIEAVDKDLYLCKTDSRHGVMLDSKGHRVE